jgi:PAS domain S-box-containing protein
MRSIGYDPEPRNIKEPSMPASTSSRTDPVPGFDLRDIFDNAPIGIFTSTPEGRYISVNPALAGMFGYESPEELIASIASIATQVYVDPADREEFMHLMREHGKVIAYECRFKRKDGTEFWVSRNVRTMRDENGRVVAYQGFTTDITDRKKAEARASDKAGFLHSLLETIPVAVFHKDREGRYRGFNRAFEGFFGKTGEEMVGKSVFDIHPPDLAEIYHAKDTELFENPGTQIYESKVENARGDVRDVIFHKASLADAQGVVTGLIGAVLDITERKQAEEKLKRIEWMLSRKPISNIETRPETRDQGYGDLTELNRDGMILKSTGYERLKSLAGDYLELLETSSAIYEANGDYAFGIFASGWCRMMDRASRNLCDTPDNAEALNSGRWLCHESCWTDCSREAIAKRAPVDIECHGGIRLYAVPIFAEGNVIGAINFGYGDPPKDPEKLRMLADTYHLDHEDLLREATAYDSRPPYMIEMAKNRLNTTAKLIGSMVETKQAMEALRESELRFEKMLAAVPDMISIHDRNMNILYSNWQGFAEVPPEKRIIHTKCHRTYRGLESICPDCRAKVVLETRVPFQEEALLPDGRWVDLRVIPFLGKDGQVEFFMEWMRDITDRRRMENENLVLAKIFKRSQDFIGVADMEENAFFVNPAGQALVGLDGDEAAKSTNIKDYFTDEDLPFVEETILPTLMAEGRWHGEFRFRHFKTGAPIPVLYDLFLTENPETGQATNITTISRDITERKRAEEALAMSEKRFHSLFDSMTELVVLHEMVFNEQGEAVNYRITDCNPAFGAITGIGRENAVGKLATDVYGTETAPYLDIYAKVVATREPFKFTTYFQPMGKYFEITAITPTKNQFATIASDVTERKQAEEALRGSEERYRNIAEANAGIVWELDANLAVTHVSGRVYEILGYEPEEIIGRNPLFLIDPEDRESIRAIMARMAHRQESIKDIEYWCRHGDGRRVRILTNGIAFFARDGGLLGFRGTHIDITETYWARRCREIVLRLHEMINDSDNAISAVLCEACSEVTDSPMAFFGMQAGRGGKEKLHSSPRPRRWNRWAGWPAGWPTISTTCWA